MFQCRFLFHGKGKNNLLKCKKFQDTEVEIIGFEEGINKLAGTLGAFICNYKGNELKVGSGLSDEDRSYFWANKEKYLGKFITVKYFEEILDGTDFVLSQINEKAGQEYRAGYLFVTMGAGDNWKIGRKVLEIAENNRN